MELYVNFEFSVEPHIGNIIELIFVSMYTNIFYLRPTFFGVAELLQV